MTPPLRPPAPQAGGAAAALPAPPGGPPASTGAARPAVPPAQPRRVTARAPEVPALARRGEPLGQVLIRMGAITAAQLATATAGQLPDGRRLGDHLVAEGIISRDQLAQAMAARMGVQYVDVATPIDPAVAALIDERTARRYQAVPVREEPDGRLLVAMADPANIFAVDDLRILTRREIRPALALPDEIQKLLSRSMAGIETVVADLVSGAGDGHEAAQHVGADISDSPDDAPIVRLVNSLIARAVDEHASDIHFEPQAKEMIVRNRVDGVLRQAATVPFRLANGVASRIKIMADLDIAEKRAPQDGRVGLNVGGRSLDLRVASLPTVYGEKIVIRVLDKSNVLMRLSDLGFSREVHSRFERSYTRPYGAVLVTGPTGSGKSTTLYGALNQINAPEKNIITVEDPVEYRLPGINQVQVNPKAGLSFAAGLRSILRCDPDVVMIGEVRDRETAQIAIESALTGHLVLATMHTNDSAAALTRLSEMGVESFLTASAVVGILAQRLVRRLCPHCKGQAAVPHAQLREACRTRALPPGLADPAPVASAVGCPRCGGTGYSGRMGVYEMLMMSEALQRLAVQGASAEEIAQQARREGMRTLLEDGLVKVLSGQTTLEELARAVG